MVQNSVQNQSFPEKHKIVQVIEKLRSDNKSYEKIGFILNITKSEVYMIYKGQWFPKRESVLHRILDNITRAGL